MILCSRKLRHGRRVPHRIHADGRPCGAETFPAVDAALGPQEYYLLSASPIVHQAFTSNSF